MGLCCSFLCWDVMELWGSLLCSDVFYVVFPVIPLTNFYVVVSVFFLLDNLNA